MAKKSIFSKTTPDVLSKRQAGISDRISAINHLSDAVGWRPVQPELPERYARFLNAVTTNAAHFLDSTKPDIYNAQFYTHTIDTETRLALEHLEREHIRNRKSINSIREYQGAVMLELETRLERLKAALADIEH